MAEERDIVDQLVDYMGKEVDEKDYTVAEYVNDKKDYVEEYMTKEEATDYIMAQTAHFMRNKLKKKK